MKKTVILSIFMVFAVNAFCQNDTTFYYKNNQIKIFERDGEMQISIKSDSLSAEEKLFRGEYEVKSMQKCKSYSGEYEARINPVFCFSQFSYNNPRNFWIHGSGLFAGFSNLATWDLTDIGTAEDARLKFSSFEVGLTMVGLDAQLSRKYGWLFFAGLGFKVQQYNADQNYAFVEENNITIQKHPDLERLYKRSRLVQWYLHAPVMLEYQVVSPRGSVFFVQGGVELGLKLSSKSSVVFRDDRDKKIRQTLGKGMNVNPLTVDVKAEIGFDDFALYVRYGLIELFRKDRGPEVYPVAAGVIWHF
ncbi:MAG: PorT family protein [Bacteroidetes bacterium]|nr:PorT family protein [Bacteroidota bacterium]